MFIFCDRAASFVTVALIYVLAVASGIAVYKSLSYDWWLNLLIADIAATGVTFAFSLPLGNASVYEQYLEIAPVERRETLAHVDSLHRNGDACDSVDGVHQVAPMFGTAAKAAG